MHLDLANWFESFDSESNSKEKPKFNLIEM